MQEPNIWPIGKAFACFVAAYVNVPVEETYSYHGIKKQCKKEPEPKSFTCKLIEKYGARWEIVYARTNKEEQVYTLDYNVLDFKPAGKWDKCTVKFPDHFRRYYFCQVEIWDGTSFLGWSMDMNGIVPCRVWSNAGQWKYYYKTFVATIWAEKPWLVWIWQWVPNSRFIVWRSTNGDMPVDYPKPIEEYHID